jgi:hypothetical protein
MESKSQDNKSGRIPVLNKRSLHFSGASFGSLNKNKRVREKEKEEKMRKERERPNDEGV